MVYGYEFHGVRWIQFLEKKVTQFIILCILKYIINPKMLFLEDNSKFHFNQCYIGLEVVVVGKIECK